MVTQVPATVLSLEMFVAGWPIGMRPTWVTRSAKGCKVPIQPIFGEIRL